MTQSKSKKIILIINICAIILLLALFVFIFIYFYDDFILLKTDEGLEALSNKIRNTGIFGVFILILIQILQVVVAFIPGEVVEVLSGVMFGPLGGLIICLIGLNIGTIIIWALVKLLGKPFVNQNIKKEEQEKLSFLNNPTRALIILFFIFLVPCIPKDILIYPIPLTKIKLSHFLIVSSISRIPSILYSTYLGNSLITQNFTALLIFGLFSVLAIVGLIFNKQIYNFIEKHIIKKIEK